MLKYIKTTTIGKLLIGHWGTCFAGAQNLKLRCCRPVRMQIGLLVYCENYELESKAILSIFNADVIILRE